MRCPHLNPEKLVPAPIDAKKSDGDTKKGDKMIAVSTINGKPYLEETFIDRIYRMFLFICIVYYTTDTFVKIYEAEFPKDLYDGCKVGFFFHHIVTIMGFKSIFIIDHYTWFLTGPMAFHTIIVGLPKLGLFNNIIYVILLSSWFYCTLKRPFWQKKVY